MEIAALLIARKGSKSVPNKNTIKVDGTPMFAHSLMAAIKSPLIDNVYVSTDCPLVKKYTKLIMTQKSVTIIDRPDELCQDKSTPHEAMMHGLGVIEEKRGKKVDILVTLLGNTPFTNTADLDRGITNLIAKWDDYDSCMSVSELNCFNPYRAYKMDNDKLVPMVKPETEDKFDYNRDSFGSVLFFNGSFWICKRETLIKNDGPSPYPWVGNNVLPLVEEEGTMEIDAPWQLKLVNTT